MNNTKTSCVVATGIVAAICGIGILFDESNAMRGVRQLGQDEMTLLVGGACRDCKTNGTAGTEADCQQCRKTGTKSSEKYNKGPVGQICTDIATAEYLYCSMTGAIVCGEVDDGGKLQKWNNLNEDCLGLPNQEVAQQHIIQTASGDACP